ncbi:hypothetical protein QL285_068315 [Trifolium repens]|nr:hypothetical protein QL285_068315 [Trifolium repens]
MSKICISSAHLSARSKPMASPTFHIENRLYPLCSRSHKPSMVVPYAHANFHLIMIERESNVYIALVPFIIWLGPNRLLSDRLSYIGSFTNLLCFSPPCN